MTENPLCNVCEINESYEHLFINCTEIQSFWTKIITVFKKCGIESDVKTLKNILIGYRTNLPEYSAVNTLFSLIGFCIYKSYFISESRIKKNNSLTILKQELQRLIDLYNNDNKKLNAFITRFRSNLS